jgi:predicted dehydrogenase
MLIARPAVVPRAMRRSGRQPAPVAIERTTVHVQPTRFGLVGTGYWAQQVHAPGLAGHPDAELVGVWGRDPGKAAELAAGYGARAYAEVEALFDAVDAVAFAVPPAVQAELALRAVAAGRHLLLEKPVATDLAAANRLVAAVQEAGVSTVVFFTDRFVPEREAWLRDRLDAGALGARAQWLASLRTPENPYAASTWRRQEGALWDVGPHAVSALLPVLGPVAGVAGARGFDDLVSVVLTHEGGATSTVQLSLTMPPEATCFGLDFYDDQGWHSRPGGSVDVVVAQQRAVTELVGQLREEPTDHRCGVRFGRDVVEVLGRIEAVLGPR